ncbi:M42 family metallopeptidase [Thermococcus thioreducens]|uniref:Glucanase n=1 Tax=Thermococcus thioreducens TaxID=277988 RepID=A0A0Q2S6Y8_9EURY|nr:M42 family metallopeptidase [Thermococcus thioreducens]ASJ12417.1 glucanase [Thermococcus thioreducens]KQH83147.1 glucanase [Thermococcus thioreducens]SEV91211.1 Putative aminopeptidase FrvX [Thermococcus thioreducens]
MERVVEILKEILEIPSPTGYTREVMAYISQLLNESGIKTFYTNKGALIAGNHPEPELVIAAHVDTLGAMVRGILPDGHLSFTRIGGLHLPAFEGEYCTIITRSGKRYRGTLLLKNPSVHVNKEAGKKERKEENMYIRLDELVEKKEDTEKLGIRPGDFIAFDPKFEYVNGFVKAHFLDDKASAAVMIDLMLDLTGELEKLPVAFFFSPYEEVGHGGSAGYPRSMKELLVVDMGVVGEGVAGKETAVSIAAKDSSGPYDYEITTRLIELAEKHDIPHVVDVFPYYGSDGSAALRAGWDVRVALIGPGVHASHGMERTHIRGLLATKELIRAYIEERFGT